MCICYLGDIEMTRWSLLFRPLHASLLMVTLWYGREVSASRALDALYQGDDGELCRYPIALDYTSLS